MRLKIISTDNGPTSRVETPDGELVEGVQSVVITHKVATRNTVTIELVKSCVDLESRRG